MKVLLIERPRSVIAERLKKSLDVKLILTEDEGRRG